MASNQKNTSKVKPENAKSGLSDKSKRIRNVALSVIGAAVLVTATVLIVLHVVGGSEPEVQIVRERPSRPTGVAGTVVTWDNLDAIREEIDRPIEDTSYNAVMSVDWTFQRWDIPSRDAYVENSTQNTRTIFFDVFLDSTDELIFESPYLHVGESLENFALDTQVRAGQHTATLVYYLVDDDYEEITYLPVTVWLNILS